MMEREAQPALSSWQQWRERNSERLHQEKPSLTQSLSQGLPVHNGFNKNNNSNKNITTTTIIIVMESDGKIILVRLHFLAGLGSQSLFHAGYS